MASDVEKQASATHVGLFISKMTDEEAREGVKELQAHKSSEKKSRTETASASRGSCTSRVTSTSLVLSPRDKQPSLPFTTVENNYGPAMRFFLLLCIFSASDSSLAPSAGSLFTISGDSINIWRRTSGCDGA